MRSSDPLIDKAQRRAAGGAAASGTAGPATSQTSVPGETRSKAGSTDGDVVPVSAEPGSRDPSRGAELEHEFMPPDGGFSRPPADAGTTNDGAAFGTPNAATRDDRIRARAYAHYEARGGDPGAPVDDWLRAEAEVGATAPGRGGQAWSH